MRTGVTQGANHWALLPHWLLQARAVQRPARVMRLGAHGRAQLCLQHVQLSLGIISTSAN
jgi:hypothetical protein